MKQRGFALVLVLWALVALAAIAVTAGATGRTEARLAANATEAARAEQLADAGIHFALNDLLASPPAADEDGVLRLDYDLDGQAIAVEVRDETGKVDLNLAPEPLLIAALNAAGIDGLDAERAAAAVLDWRDLDDDRRPLGAEAFAYRAAGREDGPANADFTSLSELRRVLSIDADMFNRLAPYVTAHGGAATLDPARADLALLEQVKGLDGLTLDRWRQARAAGEAPPPPPPALARLFAPSHKLAHTIAATVELAGGIRFRREALVWLARQVDRPYLILDWRAPTIGSSGPRRLSARAPG
ncbi:MAG: type II secretion system protein GspK [Alphaproteobacteria bacterium]